MLIWVDPRLDITIYNNYLKIQPLSIYYAYTNTINTIALSIAS